MDWTYNPKFQGSGIIACIPQSGRCPNGCADCFFQSGRSYLEPLAENLPHVPSREQARGRVVRVNDGHDSNIQRDLVENAVKTMGYRDYFFNTALPVDLEGFSGPVVLTVNPGFGPDGDMTDSAWHKLEDIPNNLMFVRARVNAWNPVLVAEILDYYNGHGIPVVLTFMAYYDVESIPAIWRSCYVHRIRTTNSYWAITTPAWNIIMSHYYFHHLVYSCGKVEGEEGTTKCVRCGNCLREYYAVKERMRVMQQFPVAPSSKG